MRPNLSVEKIAGALAAIGASVLISACGDAPKPPVNATDVPGAGEKKAGEGHCGADHKDHKPGESTCGGAKGAGSCGAGKGAGSCGAGKTDAKPADTSATAPTTAPATTPDTKPADAKPADTKPADTKKPDAKPADKKPGATPAGKKTGASSCGAGTCSAKK